MDALLPMQLEGGGLQWRQRGIRRKKAGRGKENRSHSSLGRGLLGATEAAHHCQDWGGKLLTSARSCTGEPLRVYVSLILIRSCCWNVVRMIMFIRKETRARHLRLYRSKISALCALKKKKRMKTQFVKDKLTFCGLRTLMTCVTVPWLSAGTTLLLGERSCSWNVWPTDTETSLALYANKSVVRH